MVFITDNIQLLQANMVAPSGGKCPRLVLFWFKQRPLPVVRVTVVLYYCTLLRARVCALCFVVSRLCIFIISGSSTPVIPVVVF